MILGGLYIDQSRGRDRGVFTSLPIRMGTLVEVSPVVVMSADDRVLLDRTPLHDYIFEWGRSGKECCMALGYVALYNHAGRSNCEYEMDFEARLIQVKTVRDIEAGEELFVNYNGDWDDESPVWFGTNLKI